MEEVVKKAAKAAVEGFEVEMSLACTVKVGDWDFIKPGVTGKVKFSTIPESKQLEVAMRYMNNEVLEPTLEEVIGVVQKKLREARGE